MLFDEQQTTQVESNTVSFNFEQWVCLSENNQFFIKHTNPTKALDLFQKDGVAIAPFTLNPLFCERLSNDILTKGFEHGKYKINSGSFINETKYSVIHPEIGDTNTLIKMIVGNSKFKNFGKLICSSNESLTVGYNVIYFLGTEHYLDWHRDKSPDPLIERKVGFSILLQIPTSGGEFEILNCKTKKIKMISPKKVGQINFFNVSQDHYLHRVKPCTGSRGRLSISGWFLKNLNT